MKKTELAVRLTNACTCVSEAEDILTEIDSKFGDADHGLTMTKIAKAISQAVAEADGGIQSMLDAAAMAVMMLNGGSAVPLWNTWLDGMQEAAPASDEVDVAGYTRCDMSTRNRGMAKSLPPLGSAAGADRAAA